MRSNDGAEWDFARTLKEIDKATKTISAGAGRKPLLPMSLLRLGVILLAIAAFLILLPPHTLPLEGRRTSLHFFRSNPTVNRLLDYEFHAGIDLAAPAGTPVRATAWGTVTEVGWSDIYGHYAVLSHPLGVSTFYAHMSRVRVREGSLLLGGGMIGTVGSTGRSTGPHLHLEFRTRRHSLPPGLFLLPHSIRRAFLGF